MTRRKYPFPVLALTLALALAMAGHFPSLPAAAGDDALTPEQEKAVERIIRDFLRENPGVVGEALRALMREQRLAREEKVRKKLKRLASELNGDPGSYVGGNPQGDVTMVEFFDYNCSYCKSAHREIMEMVKADGNIRFVFKEYPLLGPESVYAAKAALAAGKQGKYEAFNFALLTSRGKNTNGRVLSLAKKIGLDVERLKLDMADPEFDDILERTNKLATALDIEGTPAFVIGERLIPGLLEAPELKELVDASRKKKKKDS